MTGLLINGIVIGIMIAAPVGPVNLICIQRTLAYGRLAGFLAGLGAVVGDLLFATLAAAGFIAVNDLIGGFGMAIQLAGGVFIFLLGLKGALTPRVTTKGNGNLAHGIGGDFWHAPALTFTLTVTNPITLIGVIGIFAGAGGLVSPDAETVAAIMVVSGVALGSALWWFLLTQMIDLCRSRMNAQTTQRISQVSGVLIAAFGVWLVARVLIGWPLG